ncbi:hypothetical protein SESBI_44293 [Sesbania bispinosa]|nr:hypothetical protein SESBI_44293 [Sesbania bispinosa]
MYLKRRNPVLLDRLTLSRTNSDPPSVYRAASLTTASGRGLFGAPPFTTSHHAPPLISRTSRRSAAISSRIGRHRRRYSADFHYDALSYALNFEDDASDERPVDDLRSFSARLPASPPPKASQTPATTATAAMEIAALS